MTSTLNIPYQGDLFEVKLNGYVIARITCWYGGKHRQDMQFDDIPEAVQDKILDRVKEIINNE